MKSSNVGFDSPVTVAELGISVDDPIAHLLDSHRRIERSLIIVENAVASLSSTAPVLRAEAAAALDYELALLQLLSKLHQQDEERSLFPRLRMQFSADKNRPREIMDVCELQHREEERIFEQLAVCLRNFPVSEQQGNERLSRLESLTGQLRGLCRPHMALEDELIAVSRECLRPEDARELRQEMARRYHS